MGKTQLEKKITEIMLSKIFEERFYNRTLTPSGLVDADYNNITVNV